MASKDNENPEETPVIEVSGPRIVGPGPAWMGGRSHTPSAAPDALPRGRPPAWMDGSRGSASSTSTPAKGRDTGGVTVTIGDAKIVSPPAQAAESPLAGSPTEANLDAALGEVTKEAPLPDANPFAYRLAGGKALSMTQSGIAGEIAKALRGLPDIRAPFLTYWGTYPASFIASAVIESNLNPKASRLETNGKTAVGVFQILAENFAGWYARRNRLGQLADRVVPPSPIPAWPNDILYAFIIAAGLDDWFMKEANVVWAPGAVPTGVGIPVDVFAKKDSGTMADFIAATKPVARSSGVPLDMIFLRCWMKASSPVGALNVARSAAFLPMLTRMKTALSAVVATGYKALRGSNG